MTFGKQILQLRKEKKLSAEALAKKCEISRSYITLIENDKRLPRKTMLPKIAKALDLKLEVVIDWYLEDMRKKLEQIV
jgi:transcriptional regulator with XRE-family HTH domain